MRWISSKLIAAGGATVVVDPLDDPGAMELYKFGVKRGYCVSALHGRGVGDLEAEIVKAFPAPVEELADGEEPTRV